MSDDKMSVYLKWLVGGFIGGLIISVVFVGNKTLCDHAVISSVFGKCPCSDDNINIYLKAHPQDKGEDKIVWYKRVKGIMDTEIRDISNVDRDAEKFRKKRKKEYLAKAINEKSANKKDYSSSKILKSYIVELEYSCDKGSGDIKNSIIVVAMDKEQVMVLFIEKGLHKLYSITNIKEITQPTLVVN